MKIRAKLILGYLFVAIFAGVSSYFGIKDTGLLTHTLDHITEEHLATIEALEKVRYSGLSIVSSTSEFGFIKAEHMAASEARAMVKVERGKEEEEAKQIKSAIGGYNSALAQYETLVNRFPRPGDDTLLSKVRTAGQKMQATSREIVALKMAEVAGLKILEKKEEFEADEDRFREVLDEAISIEHGQITKGVGEMQSAIATAIQTLTVVGLLTFSIAVFSGVGIARAISKPITKLRNASIQVSNGMWDVAVDVDSKDEIGELATSFNQMTRELKRSRTDLVTARDFVGNVFKSMVNALVVTDTALTIQRVNHATLTLLGYEEHELIGKSVTTVFEEPESAVSWYDGLLEKGRIDSLEMTCITRSGRKVPISLSGSIIHDESGKAEGIVCVAQDLTERRRAEDERLRLAGHIHLLMQSTGEGIYGIDLNGNCTFINRAANEMLGTKAEEALGRNMHDLAHHSRPDGTPAPVDQCKIFRAFKQGQGCRVDDEVFWRSDGTSFPVEYASFPIVEDDAVRGAVVTFVDITERKKREHELLVTNTVLNTEHETSLDGILVVNQEHRMISLNRNFVEMWGISAEVVKSQSDERALHSVLDKLEAPDEFLQGVRYLYSHKEEKLRDELKLKDGRIFDRYSAPMIGADGIYYGRVFYFRDVTERTHAERALRESEQRYKTLFDAATDAITILEADGERAGSVVAANRAAAESTGYTIEELESLTIGDLQPQKQSELSAQNRQRLAEGEHVTLELLRRRKDGTTFPIEVNAGPLVLGGRQYILSFGRDITQRKLIEKEVAMLAHAIRSIQESVVITDSDDRLLFVNDAFLKTYGYERNEVLGRDIVSLVRPAASVANGNSPEKLPSTWEGELINRRKDGSEFPIHLTASPIVDEAGHTIAFAAVSQDISERKRIGQEVSMLAHALRSINESVIVTDLVGRIIFQNEAASRAFGYESNELLGRHVSVLDPQTGAAPRADDVLDGAIHGVWEGEIISRRKDGSEFPNYLSVSTINDERGEPIALVGVSQDITDRKNRMAELQNAKEVAEAASRAKSEFLANMSHEIRTPMNGIIGMTELALDTGLTDEQREYLRMVKLSADSLLGVINDVLDFSKIEAGKLELDPAEFVLQDAVDEVMKALAVRADHKGLELAYYLRPGVPQKVVGDVGRLRQILVNLVGNAIKFTERGEVIVRVEVESKTDDEVVLHFAVRDTGVGVPPAKHKMIFESFTQADGSTTRKFGGTGLGLTISAQLVEMMGGEIWVESPVDLPSVYGTPGSIFQFTGRFGLPADSSVTTRPAETFDLQGIPVLVVDDNATNRKILEVQLTTWLMKPSMVEGAQSALRAIKEAATAGSPFKLILLDFHMPEMDGLALADRIKLLPEGRQVKIIIMSSSVQRSRAGLDDWSINASLLKPVKAADLLASIRTALGAGARSHAQTPQPIRKSAHPSRVLVAEDSMINQELIRRLLEKWGHTPVIAQNGREAISLFEKERFDLVLMDLQMPELNGFEATHAIRSLENGSGARIPIIALTAHALKDDRERCIEAGMDDYISKPLDVDVLFELVEAAAKRQVCASATEGKTSSAVDVDRLMRNVDGDTELLMKLASIFAESSSGQLAEVKKALAKDDAADLARAAHLLKGSISNFGAKAAVDAALHLETIANSGDLSLADSAFETLAYEVDRVMKELLTLNKAGRV